MDFLFYFLFKLIIQSTEFKIDYSNKIISFSKLLEDNHKIEGLVRVVQDNPVLVEITIRR